MRDNQTIGGRWVPVEIEQRINELKRKGVLFALCLLCNNVRNQHICIISASTTTVCYINNMGGSKSRDSNDIAKRIWRFALQRNYFFEFSPFARKAKHVS